MKKKKIYYRIDCTLESGIKKYLSIYNVMGERIVRLVNTNNESIYYNKLQLENLENIIIENMGELKIQSYNFKKM